MLSILKIHLNGGSAMLNSVIYIDCENVSVDELREWLFEVDQRPDTSIMMIKAYGNRNALAAKRDVLYKYDVITVDTTTAASNKKNAADMKIAVDCISDSYKLPGIDCVVLLSKDHDFEPVLAALRERGIFTESKIEVDEVYKTIGDLNNWLVSWGYLPPLPENAMQNVFMYLRSVAAKKFTDNSIDQYINYKLTSLVKKVTKIFGVEAASQVKKLGTRNLSVESFYEIIKDYSDKEKRSIYDVFTETVYGFQIHKYLAE